MLLLFWLGLWLLQSMMLYNIFISPLFDHLQRKTLRENLGHFPLQFKSCLIKQEQTSHKNVNKKENNNGKETNLGMSPLFSAFWESAPYPHRHAFMPQRTPLLSRCCCSQVHVKYSFVVKFHPGHLVILVLY